MCLKMSPEGVQRSRGTDGEWKVVPLHILLQLQMLGQCVSPTVRSRARAWYYQLAGDCSVETF